MPNRQQHDPWDDLTRQPDYTDEQVQQFERLDNLIHRVFEQNPDGKELLELWVEHGLLRGHTAMPGMGLLEIGIAEGQKTFIRNICLTIEKVNKNGQ